MKKIKLIIFDFGGVLGTDAIFNSVKKLSKTHGISKDEFIAATKSSWHKARINPTDDPIYWKAQEALWGLNRTKILLMMFDETRIYKSMLKLSGSLSKKYRVVILSNHIKSIFGPTVKKYQLNKYFSEIYTSYDLGLAKPDKKIYRKVLKIEQVKPDEVVFIDDLKHNVDAAKELGIQVVHYKNVNDCKKKLKKLL